MIGRRGRWGMIVAFAAFAAFAALATHGSAHASGEMDTEAERRDRARLIGVLDGTELSVSLEGAPARQAFQALAEAIDVPIRGRWARDRIGHGIDPEIEIWLDIDRANARFILELMLEQCEDYEPCTWQLRRGYVEVGTKERLSTPSARSTRIYPIRELMIEPPTNISRSSLSEGGLNLLPLDEFMERKYATAMISLPAQHMESGQQGISLRKYPPELALETVHGIVETVEPGNWETGEPVEPDDNVEAPVARRADGRPVRRRLVQDWKIARIRQYRGEVIITAPDYVHRQVMGYPNAVPPAMLTDEERTARSSKASSTEGITFGVLPPDEEADQ